MKKKSLPIVSAIFLVVAMTVQFIVSYQREKKDLISQIEYKMELAQKDFIFEMYKLAIDETVSPRMDLVKQDELLGDMMFSKSMV